MMDNLIDDFLIFNKSHHEASVNNDDLDGLLKLFERPSRDLFLADDFNTANEMNFDYCLESEFGFDVAMAMNLDTLDDTGLLFAGDELNFDNLSEQDFDYLLRDTSDESSNELQHNHESNSSSTTSTTLTSLAEMFPHIADERNKRRRSLLYETSQKVPNSSAIFNTNNATPVQRQKVSHDALIMHDYAQKRCGDDDK